MDDPKGVWGVSGAGEPVASDPAAVGSDVATAIHMATEAIRHPEAANVERLALAVLAMADELDVVRLQRDAAWSREEARLKAQR